MFNRYGAVPFLFIPFRALADSTTRSNRSVIGPGPCSSSSVSQSLLLNGPLPASHLHTWPSLARLTSEYKSWTLNLLLLFVRRVVTWRFTPPWPVSTLSLTREHDCFLVAAVFKRASCFSSAGLVGLFGQVVRQQLAFWCEQTRRTRHYSLTELKETDNNKAI